jgi:hypothetical protein
MERYNQKRHGENHSLTRSYFSHALVVTLQRIAMEYEGYINKEQIGNLVERDFPFTKKPDEAELYCRGESDLMRRIISKTIKEIKSDELSLNQLYDLYDEFGTLSSMAGKWIFPSILRRILKNLDSSEFLHESLVFNFDNANFEDNDSAYNFSWLTEKQSETLVKFFEYLSEVTDHNVSLAQKNAEKYGKM